MMPESKLDEDVGANPRLFLFRKPILLYSMFNKVHFLNIHFSNTNPMFNKVLFNIF